jgi:hypothetical protein
MEHPTSVNNNSDRQAKSQGRAHFGWPKLRKAIEFYESERLCYLPAAWGQKNPRVSWEEYQTRLPTIAEKAEWFHEGRATNIGVLCGGISGDLVILCFNDHNGATEFFGDELWRRLLTSTFVTKSVRGYHIWLRPDTPIKSSFVRRRENASWLEIRSDGDFTVAPPSLHPAGVLYEAIGINDIVKPKNLAAFIDERLTQLGLRAQGTREPPEREPKTKEPRAERSDQFNTIAIEKLLENCAFLQYCRDNATTLSEPWWWSTVCILAVFGNPGKEKIHELSQPYPRYTEKETNQKIEEAKKAADKAIGPHTCAFIQQDLGFDCPADCLAKKLSLKSPTGLATRLARLVGLPIIVVTNRFLREKTADTIAAVEQANNPPQIFERSGHIVRIGHDEFGAPYIETLTESACRGFLERAGNYVRANDKGETIPLPAPPLDIVRDFMSFPQRNLPALLAVTEVPVLRSDGSIVTEPGYDEATHLYYQPVAGLIMPPLPDNPSKKQLEAAVAFIREPVIDFPFDSEASRANALAVMVTPIYRPMIAGPVPLCLIDKPQPGTGAGLLADVIAIIATGRPAAMMAPPKNDEECEKRLTSILRHGRAVITIDNLDGYLYFASLAMILTATTVQTRILGQSEELLLPNRATYIVTGNNVRLAGDLPRRCYLSRMDAREARPWMRDPKSFKYQNLIQWVKEKRGELLAAILTLARAWIAAGKPIPDRLPPLGGFEDWTNIVGGVLAYAGIRGFLGNLDFMYSQSDAETTQWEAFLATWFDIIGDKPMTVVDLISHINENPDFRATLPDVIGDPEVKNYSVKLGQALGKRNGVRYPNGFLLEKFGKSHQAVTWKVGRFDTPTSPHFSYEGEVGEVQNTLAYKEKGNNDKKDYKNVYRNGVTPTSPTSPLDTKEGRLVPDNTSEAAPTDLWQGMPDYPKEPCYTCGSSDFWPDFEGKRFVYGRCHPQPPQIDMEI